MSIIQKIIVMDDKKEVNAMLKIRNIERKVRPESARQTGTRKNGPAHYGAT